MAKKPPPRPLSLVSPSSRPPASTEWVGGIRDMPDVPALGGRMSLVVWVTEGRILVGEPAPRASAKQVLAMRVKAAAATEGRPLTVRVATQDEAARVRAVLGRDVAVRVGPTPEVDTAFDTIMGQLAEIAELADLDDDDDDVAPSAPLPHPLQELLALSQRDRALVARHAERAAALYHLAPWDLLPGTDMVLAVDAPSRPWKRATVHIVGQNREVVGYMLFATADDCLRFQEQGPLEHGDHDVVVLEFDPAEGMPSSVRHELDRLRWTLARPDAIPLLLCMSRSRAGRPLRLDDVARVSFVTAALVAFFTEHQRALKQNMFDARQSAVKVDGEGVIVRYDDVARFAEAPDLLAAYHEEPEEPEEPEVSPAPTELAAQIDALFRRWSTRFAQEHPEAIRAACDEMVRARRGSAPTRAQVERDSQVLTSLPVFWGALYRPWRGHEAGLTALVRARDFDDLRGAREALASARLVYGEYLGDDARGVSRLRDLADGAVYEVVGIDVAQRARYARWIRVLTVIVPLGDGRWYPPSLVSASGVLAELSLDDLVARTRAALAAMRRPLDATGSDALRAALLREMGVVFGVMQGFVDAVEARPPKKLYMVNSDGDGVEFVEAVLEVKGLVKKAYAALEAAGDFAHTDETCWDLIDRSRTLASPEGECMGQILREGGRWLARANSPARMERLLDRLAAVLGARPKERSRTVDAPWANSPTVVRTKAEADETVQIASGPASAETFAHKDDPAAFVVASMRRSLDADIPMMGGTPRALAKTPEGRAKVEEWMRLAELRGLAPGGPTRMLDLDPLRRELRMPTVI